MSPSNIKITREECELCVQFKLDDLDIYFSRQSTPGGPRYTDTFGPGLYFGFHSLADTNRPRHLGLYLYTTKDYPPLSVTFTVSASSSSGKAYFSRSMSHSFKSGEAIGWSKFLSMEAYQSTRGMEEENVLVLHATLKFTPLYPIVDKPTLKVIHRTVAGSGAMDVRYVVYLERKKRRDLSKPRVLFGTRDVLTEKSSATDDIFQIGLHQLSGITLGHHEQPKPHAITHYTDDDSDFEDDHEADSTTIATRRPSIDRTPSIPTKPRGHPMPGVPTGPRISLLARIDAENETVAVKPEPDTPISRPSSTTPQIQATVELPPYDGDTIVMTGVAAHTWEAVLFWLYTGTIQFAPLTSEGRSEREAAVKAARQANPDRPPPVSCKSVYRIADALKLDALKKQALSHLERRLSMQTYLHEVFSDFTSKYEEVRKLEMLAVIKHWDQIKNSSALRTKMADIANGKLPHAGPIMTDLLMKASVKDTDADTSSSIGERRDSTQRSGSSSLLGRKRSLEDD